MLHTHTKQQQKRICFSWLCLSTSLPLYLWVSLSVFSPSLFLSTVPSWSCLLPPFWSKNLEVFWYLVTSQFPFCIDSSPLWNTLHPHLPSTLLPLGPCLLKITSNRVVCVCQLTCQAAAIGSSPLLTSYPQTRKRNTPSNTKMRKTDWNIKFFFFYF